MPIISRIGARSWKVRALYTAMYVVLIVGACSMIYPFMLMLSGSVKSEADFQDNRPIPSFWFDDTVLLRKYVESKYNVELNASSIAWWRPVGSWTTVEKSLELPPGMNSPYLPEFLQWRSQCPWWLLGHRTGGRMLPRNAREFNAMLYDRYEGDITALARDQDVPFKNWNMVAPANPPVGRFADRESKYYRFFTEWAKNRPVEDRVIDNLDGTFWKAYLVPKYTMDIAEYNKKHDTKYTGYHEVFFASRAPENKQERTDWEDYVRNELPLKYIRLSPDATDEFRTFLHSKSKYADIGEYNSAFKTNHRSFDDIELSTTVPANPIAQVDWEQFIKNKDACPLDAISVYGPRQSFEEFVAKQRGVSLQSFSPIAMPVAEADLHDVKANSGAIRTEFTTRNYRQVVDYILLHGNGLRNTVIYCALAIATAMLVNPLAAYALSRYKMPSAYTILLFCMTTMAFPGEVTLIPSFLLLKRFPLWSLVGLAVGFFIALWILNRVLRDWPELLRMTLAIGVGILTGFWLTPHLVGDPNISLLNTFAALVLPGMASGFSIFLLKGFFDSLPRELYEAAEIDGAGEFTKFWTITMSLSKPILAVIALGAFTGAYSAFLMALIIIPDQKMWTMMVWLFQLQSISHQSVVYASLVIAAIPTFLVFVFCQNLIMRGIVVPVEK